MDAFPLVGRIGVRDPLLPLWRDGGSLQGVHFSMVTSRRSFSLTLVQPLVEQGLALCLEQVVLLPDLLEQSSTAHTLLAF